MQRRSREELLKKKTAEEEEMVMGVVVKGSADTRKRPVSEKTNRGRGGDKMFAICRERWARTLDDNNRSKTERTAAYLTAAVFILRLTDFDACPEILNFC